ncbi:MAG: hypothetical protein JO335_11300 [Sphingomonas sp.]|nr:hypothetical protein [Sphingomonas sp.]
MTRRQRVIFIALALLSGGFFVGWVTAGTGIETGALVAPTEPWRDPSVPSADPASTLATLAMHPLWGAEHASKSAVAPVAAEKAATSWRLTGIFAEFGRPKAVILVTEPGKPGGRKQIRQAGDGLPDGSRITEIGTTAIVIDAGDKRRQVKLFSRN